MECPYCKNVMEYGYIKSQEAGVYYLPSPGEDDSLFSTKKSVKKQGGISLDGPALTRFHRAKIPCWRCKKCRKIILSYSEE